MPLYRTGKVSLTMGARAVTGDNTEFGSETSPGDILVLPGALTTCYEILSVESDTALTLDADALESVAASDYVIIRSVSTANNLYLMRKIEEFLKGRQANLVEFTEWMTGNSTGGPNGDGLYPMTDRYGEVTMVKSLEGLTQEAAESAEQISELLVSLEGLDQAVASAAASAEVAQEARDSVLDATEAASEAAAQAVAAAASVTESTVAAATSATNAADSASAALSSKTAADLSETNAATSAQTASTESTTATTKAQEAADSAAAALISQNEADDSKSAAATAAADAQGSATAAQESETNATTLASHALDSKNAAGQSATNADDSASTAFTYKNQAGTYATNAATSETNAGTSANTASVRAGEASTSAAGALASKNAAGLSETNAATYRDEALDSKNVAGLSETAALAAKEAAASSATEAAASAASIVGDKEAAAASAADALVSEGVVTTASAEAQTASELAKAWANKLTDPVENGEFSAHYWALKSALSAAGDAADVSYDPTGTPLQSGNVQDGITELAGIMADGIRDYFTIDATQSDDFTADNLKTYLLQGDWVVTLPAGAGVGNVVHFVKLQSATPTISVPAGGALIQTSKGTDTSVIFDVDTKITFLFNGTNWEV